MAREIYQAVRAEVLWDAGHRTPKSMKRRGNIPERSAERYIAKLRRGESLERKKRKKQKPSEKKTKTVRKVINKLSRKGKSHSIRELATSSLKHQVSQDMPTSIKSLKKSIRTHWKKITPEFLDPYFEGMPKRMEQLIEKEGERINY